MQSHGVRRVWLRVLLAVQERNHRFTLSEPFGMHVLGHEALVAKEEIAVAAWHARWRARDDCFSGRNCCASDDYRLVWWFESNWSNLLCLLLSHYHSFKLLKICVQFFLGIPVWVGRKLHSRYKGASRHKRNSAVMGGVAASVSRYHAANEK